VQTLVGIHILRPSPWAALYANDEKISKNAEEKDD